MTMARRSSSASGGVHLAPREPCLGAPDGQAWTHTRQPSHRRAHARRISSMASFGQLSLSAAWRAAVRGAAVCAGARDLSSLHQPGGSTGRLGVILVSARK
jgi:hypothetical protein